MKRRSENLMVMFVLNLQIMPIFQFIEVISKWYSTAAHYAKCYIISGHIINKTLERKTTKELV